MANSYSRIKNALKLLKHRSVLKHINFNGRSCVVLLYHRVYNYTSDPQLLAVRSENFDSQLKIIKTESELLTVADFESAISGKIKFPKRSVLLTFDDGYADNLHNAIPILNDHSAQAIFYICTGHIDTFKEFWWDELELLLLQNKACKKIELVIDGKPVQYNLDTDKTVAYTSLLPILRNRATPSREAILMQIRAQVSDWEYRSSHRALSKHELCQLHGNKAAVIGGHTQGHASLGALTDQEQEYEISQSLHYLTETLQAAPKHFSFPFGTRHDYNQTSVELLRKNNIQFNAANYPDVVTDRSNQLAFPRFLVRDWNKEQFRQQLNSFVKY
jgi:peptidoglycan/xylan/chitin deacetylase (PgdA/CDA1 family)